MKKLFGLFIVAVTTLFAASGTAMATPMLYTFDGTVSSVTDDAGIIAGAGLAVGSTVTYTLIVDLAAPGTMTLNDGTIYVIPEGTFGSHYWFADYVSGDAIWQKDGGMYNGPIDVAEYNFGSESSGALGTSSSLLVNSRDDLLTISNYTDLISSWGVGTAVTSSNLAYNADEFGSSYLEANLTLTSISHVSVAEPSTLLLLGSGLIGFGAATWHKRSRHNRV